MPHSRDCHCSAVHAGTHSEKFLQHSTLSASYLDTWVCELQAPCSYILLHITGHCAFTRDNDVSLYTALSCLHFFQMGLYDGLVEHMKPMQIIIYLCSSHGHCGDYKSWAHSFLNHVPIHFLCYLRVQGPKWINIWFLFSKIFLLHGCITACWSWGWTPTLSRQVLKLLS